MSKTPLKYNAGLVEGQYRAQMAGVGQDGMGQAMDNIAGHMQKFVDAQVERKKELRKVGDDLAKQIEANGGSLDQSWMTACRPQVEKLHGNYDRGAAWGKKKQMAENQGKLNSLSAQVATVKDLTNDISSAQNDGDWSNSQTESEQHIFNAFMDPNTEKKFEEVDGKWQALVYVGEDNTEDGSGWMTADDVNRLYNEQKKDYATMTDIRKQALNIKEKAKEAALQNKEAQGNFVPEEMSPEYFQQLQSKMETSLRKGNIKSLINDDVLEAGASFKEHLSANPEITGMSYESLGINPSLENRPEQAGNEALIGKGSIDLDGDGKISQQEFTLLSEEDKAQIIDAMTNPKNPNFDEERTRKEMAKYFTTFITNNYNKEFSRHGGQMYSDAALQYGEDEQTQADNFMKEQGII